ncbi:MAG TPA: TlpA disulfide reductase family protein [Candidatus Polarisedimenticolaceae bacterium]|nr:TlpA disulfide reductase family protein [Candidatus Polarisedimenticolaceae bacterium]
MKTCAVFLLAATLLAGPVAAADLPAAIPPGSPPTAIDPATGETVALDPAGGPMHVVFLATWCRPCLTEIPKLFDLEDRWKADGYRLVLVAVATRQSAERLREFRAQTQVPGRLLFDEHGSVAAAFGAATIPSHVLVDRRGGIVARAGALDPPFTQAVERLVRQEGRSKP